MRVRLHADVIVDRIPETLLAPEISLRRLDGDVTQEKLDLFQFASGLVAQACAGRRSCGATDARPQLFPFSWIKRR